MIQTVFSVGTSKMIADGKIKMKSDSPIASFAKKGLMFADGSTLEADVIVFATGFKDLNMRDTVRDIMGHAVADKCSDSWGINAEGEIRGLAKPFERPSISLQLFAQSLLRLLSRDRT